MFNLTTRFIFAVSVLILGGVSAASAQLANGEALKVSVPSAFVVSDKTFPAGVYTIERTPSTNDSPSLLIIRGEKGESMIFDTIIGQSNQRADQSELVFESAGGTNYLSKIVIKGDTAVNEIPKTKAQNRKIAADKTKDSALTIASTDL